MGLLTRWLSERGRGRSRLAVEALESRTTPASLLTPGTTAGTLADGDAADAPLGASFDGRYVLFASKATNLVAGATDANADYDLFWRDTTDNATKLVTAQAGTLNALGFGGTSLLVPLAGRAVLSRDGLRVAYVSAASAAAVTGDGTMQDQVSTNDVYWWRADTAAAKIVSVRFGTNVAVGNAVGIEAYDPAISDDGGQVAYGTFLDAATIDFSAALDNGNTTYDLYRRDMTATDATKATTAITRIPGKADVVGRYGAVDRPVGRYLSGDGRFAVFSTIVGADAITSTVPDRADTTDVFVRDMNLNTSAGVALASVAVDGKALGNTAGLFANNAVISRNGATVVFVSNASGGTDAANLVTGYTKNGAPSELYARLAPFSVSAVTKLVTAVSGSDTAGANGFVNTPPGIDTPATYTTNSDGTLVFFVTSATNLGNSTLDRNGSGLDVMVRNLTTGGTEYVSVAKDGRTGTAPSTNPSVSEDGRFVGFLSSSPELGLSVSDANGVQDAFVRDRTAGVTKAISTTLTGLTTGDAAATSVVVAGGGTVAAFGSHAKNLTATSQTAAVSNLYATELPVPGLTGGADKVVAVAGTADGIVKGYVLDSNGKLVQSGTGFTPFTGTVNIPARVAVGDVNGDGTADTIMVIGPGGGSLIRIIDGVTGGDLVAPVATYEPSFTGGLFAAAGDLDGDKKAEIILSPDVGGGARVQIFSFNGTSGLTLRANFFGIDDPNFRGGGRVAVGDINGDTRPEVVVGAGFGGGPRVATYDGASIFAVAPGVQPVKLYGDFFAFPGEDATTLRNGVYVAVGDINADGNGDYVFGGGPGGGPRVYVLSGSLVGTLLDTAYGKPLANFFAYESTQRGGVRVALKNVDGDTRSDIVVSSGERLPSNVKTYLSKNLPAAGTGDPAAFESIDPFGSTNVPGGVFVG